MGSRLGEWRDSESGAHRCADLYPEFVGMLNISLSGEYVGFAWNPESLELQYVLPIFEEVPDRVTELVRSFLSKF